MFRSMLFLLILTFAATGSYAQTEKGSILVNGRTNLQFEFGEDAPFTLGLLGGYFPVENLAVGFDIELRIEEEMNFVQLRPFARYYLWKRLFFGTGLRYESQSNNDTQFSWDLELGALIMLTDQVGLEPTLRVPIPRNLNVAVIIGFSFFF